MMRSVIVIINKRIYDDDDDDDVAVITVYRRPPTACYCIISHIISLTFLRYRAACETTDRRDFDGKPSKWR